MENQSNCPSCGTPTGEVHTRDCEIGLCRTHGERRTWCMGTGEHPPTTYQGAYPGTHEAVARGWITTSGDGKAIPDINRVIIELTWSPESESYV